MVRSIGDYLRLMETRMDKLEKDNKKLLANHEFMVQLLKDLVSYYNGKKKYRFPDLIERLGNYLIIQANKKPEERKVDLISDIIKGHYPK